MWLITTFQYVYIDFHVLMSYILLCVTYGASNWAPSDFNVKYTVLSLTPTIRLFKCSSLTFNAPSNALAHFIHSQKGNYSGTQKKSFNFFNMFLTRHSPREDGMLRRVYGVIPGVNARGHSISIIIFLGQKSCLGGWVTLWCKASFSSDIRFVIRTHVIRLFDDKTLY